MIFLLNKRFHKNSQFVCHQKKKMKWIIVILDADLPFMELKEYYATKFYFGSIKKQFEIM